MTDVPSGTGRGCLGSGGKPTGLLRKNGGGGDGGAGVSSGTDGDSQPLGWRGTFRCSPATEHNKSMVGQGGHVHQEKHKYSLRNRTPWWRTTVYMRKTV